ncbi:MAG TPA: NAD(P)H-binding protein [Puia sp.]|nr:NAD(P)H-binding protein [Puia sp.]
MKKAIIAGASGLIGSHLLQIILDRDEYDEVLILVRKELPLQHKKLKQLVIDYTRLKDYTASIKGDAIFCCLGTTSKKTPDETEYRKIDHDYPLQLAEIARGNNIAQYHLVSAASANASSKIFYSRLKGETEDDIKKTGLSSLQIYRPMLLTGNRNEKRTGEGIATAIFKVIDPLLIGGLKKYRSIAGKTVATTIYKQSLKNENGVFVYRSDKIQELSSI